METRRLGQLVIERRLATPAHVEACLSLQKRKAEAGEFVPLGQVFVDQGVLTPAQVQELLGEQNRRILACPRCRTQVTVDAEATRRFVPGGPDAGPACPRCGTPLVLPERLERVVVEESLATARGAAGDGAAPRADEAPRHRLGRYEIVGEISRGGMGIVYKARDPESGRMVALKVMRGDGSAKHEAEDRVRFAREAEVVSRLRHPHIVGILDVGKAPGGVHYYAMDYVRGISLAKLLEETPPPPQERLLLALEKIAGAVDYAHGRGVLHRDLKPSNILVDEEGEPHLIDFGIAKFEGAQDLTRSGTFLGSAAYMAPEYIEGESPRFDARTDVYALGICLYQALTGKTPFADDDTLRMLRRVLESEAPPVARHAREGVRVSRELATVVMTAIERDPAWRYQTAGDLARDLERLRRGEPIRARPRSLAQRLVLRARRHAAAIALVAVALAFAGVAWWRLSSIEGAVEERVRVRTRAIGDDLVAAGSAHLAGGHAEAAHAAFSAALTLDPDHATALWGRALAAEALGDADPARRDRARALALDADVATRFAAATAPR